MTTGGDLDPTVEWSVPVHVRTDTEPVFWATDQGPVIPAEYDPVGAAHAQFEPLRQMALTWPGHIAWATDDAKPAPERTPFEVLFSFLETPPDEFDAFAHKLGPLDLCAQHGLPWGHPMRQHALPGIARCTGVVARDEGSLTWKRSPIMWWLAWREALRALLDVGKCLRDGRPAEPDVWLAPLFPFSLSLQLDLDVLGRDVEEDRAAFVAVLRSCLEWARLTPRVAWPQRRTSPTIELLPTTTFSVLVLGLLQATTRAQGFVSCDGCGRLFAPTRRPQAGLRRFCPECRDTGVPQAEASRDYRSRRQQS